MDYPFTKTDGGKAADKRRPHTNDCAIRALALATGIPYSDCYDELADYYRKRRGTDLRMWIDLMNYNETDFRGFTFKWIPFKAVKGQRRMNPVEFCRQFTTGTYIARTARHVFAVIDGVVHDSWKQRPDRCIYGAWQIERVPNAPLPNVPPPHYVRSIDRMALKP